MRFALRLLVAALPIVAVAAPPPQSDVFNVTANVVATCQINPDDLLFGDVDLLLGDTATGTINVRCTKGHTYQIAIVGNREMTSGSDVLPFTVETTLGATLTETDTLPYTPDPARTSFAWETVSYQGRIAPETDAPIGSYTGTLTAQVNF